MQVTTWQLAQATALPPSGSSRRQFLFTMPPAAHDVHYTYVPVTKLGPILRSEAASAEPTWGEAHVATFCSSIVRLDDGCYRMYYTATSADRGEMWIAVAESGDGLTWHRPPLGQHAVGRQPANRIVFDGLDDQHAVVQPQVLRLPDGRWRMYLWRHAPRDLRYLVAHSDDGLRWQIDDPPCTALVHPNVLGPGSAVDGWMPDDERQWPLKALRTNDACYVYHNALRDRYEFYAPWLVPAVPNRRVEADNAPGWHRYIHRRLSDDGLQWSAPELILLPDARDPWDLQFYYLAVQWHEDWMIGSLGHYRVEAGQQTQDLALAFSRDGRTWHRPLRGGFIPRQGTTVPSPRALEDPAPDALGIYAPNAWIDEGETWLCLYSGTHLPHNRAWGDVARPRPIMGARWPKHRFVGLKAGRVPGGFLSEPFYPQGDVITVDAAIDGWLRAELCDVFGRKHEGYHLMDAAPVIGDATAHVLRWRGADTRRFRYDAVRLRLEYVDGVVYSIAFP